MKKLMFSSDCYGETVISSHGPDVARARSLVRWIMIFLVAGGHALTAGALVYQGETNTALGSATLAIECCVSNLTSGGQDGLALVVSNLGSSGQDGVSIALPTSQSAVGVEWLALDASNTLPVGAYVQEQAVGMGGGGVAGSLGMVTVTKAATNHYAVSADFSAIGTSTYTVQAYFKGILVAQATNQNGATLAQVASMNFSAFIGWVCCPWTFEISLDWGASGTRALLGTTLVTCDYLSVTPDNVSLGSAPTAFEITASEVPVITITSENASLVYQGLTNTSLGSASVSIACCVSNLGSSGQDGVSLVVSNLGSSGQDGVSIALPGYLTGLDVGMVPLDVSNALPVGAYVEEQLVGSANSVTNGVLGSVQVTKSGTNNYAVSANFSPLGASTYTVQAYLQGVLVAQATGQSNQPQAATSLPDSCGFGTPPGNAQKVTTFLWGAAYLDWTVASSITFSGGTNVTCDHLFITPENVAPGSVATAFQITASQVPALTIYGENESLSYQGLINAALGNASLSIACCVSNLGSSGQDGLALIITNLGSSGQDGVSIALPANLTGVDVGIEQLDVGNTLPVGAYVQERVIGPPNGIANGVLGTVTVTKAGTSNYVVSANFSPLGASSYTVQAYLHGVLVAQTTNQNGGALASCPIWPFTFDKEVSDEGGTIWTIDWNLATAVTLTGGANVNCDRLFVTPNNVPANTATAFEITASQVSSLTIYSENASLAYQGLVNTSLGNASVSIACCVSNLGSSGQDGVSLVVSNLGSSGQDGVSIAMPANLTGLDVGIEPLDVSNTLPVGAFIQGQAVGTANGIINGILGAVTVTKECAVCGGSNYLVSANFSPLGTSTYIVRAYLHGILVAQATNQPGASLRIFFPFWPTTLGVSNWTIYLDYGSATSLSLGGASVMCDHLYISPVMPPNVPLPAAATAFQIVASQVPSFTIISENVSQIYGGLNSTTLGSATLAVTGSQMVISNLGSSGQDGVSFALPASFSALELNWLSLDLSNTLPIGAFVQEQGVGTANGVTNGVLGTVTVTKAGISNYVVSADFSPLGASNDILQAYLQGIRVAQTTNLNGATLATCASWPCPDLEYIPSQGWVLTVHFPFGPANVSIGTGSAVTCDHLSIGPGNRAWSNAPTALQIVASQVPSLNVTAATVSPSLLSLSVNNQTVTLQWYGTAVLQSSTDLTTWTDVTNALSPYTVTPQTSGGPSKFYRLIFRP